MAALVLSLLVLSQSELLPLNFCFDNKNNHFFHIGNLRLSVVVHFLRLFNGEQLCGGGGGGGGGDGGGGFGILPVHLCLWVAKFVAFRLFSTCPIYLRPNYTLLTRT